MKVVKTVLVVLIILVAGLIITPQSAKADWIYTIRRGDSLYNIARRTGVSINSLRKRNGLGWNYLRIGQRITIPTGDAAASIPPRTTGGDLYLLARIIHGEAGAEPYLGKVAVGGVVMNRIQSPKFPKTIAGVVYQPHAFESVSNGIIYQRPPSNDSIKAASAALGGWDPSGGALYFFNPAKTNNPWIWARRIINRIGKHIFAI